MPLSTSSIAPVISQPALPRKPEKSNQTLFWLAVLVLLVIVASRLTRINDFETDRDELVSVLHTRATTFDQAVAWVPNDEPPLSYFLFDVWARLTGPYPQIMRVCSSLISLVGYAFTYRLGRKLAGDRAALLAPLVYAALAYTIIIDLKLRSYFLIGALMPVCLWLTIRYFERPTLKRALPLALVIGLMFYTTYTSAFAFLAIGLYTLAMYGRRVWRWWLPGVIVTILVLPQVLSTLLQAYKTATAHSAWQPYLFTLSELFRKFTQGYTGLWAAVLVIALLLLTIRRPPLRRLVALALWIVGVPTLMYLLLDPRFTYPDSGRYLVWIMSGLALLIAMGLARLPRPLTAVAGLGFTMLMLLPVSTGGYFRFPYTHDFEWLKQNVHAGDVFMVDPRCDCPFDRELNYYVWLYFPGGGLERVDQPGDNRRVWLITGKRKADAATLAGVQQNRIESIFVGPPELKFQLYEGPPDSIGTAYDNGMRFHGYDLIEPVSRTPLFGLPDLFEQQMIRLRLWWTVDHPVDHDYDVGVYLTNYRDSSRIYDQAHGPARMVSPAMPDKTSGWQPGKLYAETVDLKLPAISGNNAIRDQVWLRVNRSDDPAPIHADTTDDDGFMSLLSIRNNPW